MSTNVRALLALGAAACLLIACPPGGGGSDSGADAAPDGGPDAPSDGPASDGTLDGPQGDGGAPGDGGGDATLGDAGFPDGSTDGGGDAGSVEGGGGCGFDAGAPPGPPACPNGWVDPGEECDSKGLGRACSSSCQVDDFLAVQQLGSDGGLANSARTLGAGRHPLAVAYDNSFGVAYLEPASLTLSLAAFGPSGVPVGAATTFSASSTIVQNSNPVLAALPCSASYLAAWTDFGGDGDGLGVAMRVVQPGSTVTGAPGFANTNVVGPQLDPDVLVTASGQIVIAWEDDSNPATQPDLRLRMFDASLHPTSGEQTLAGTPDSEADVALAAFGGSWAAAWRDDASGLETVQVQAGATRWTLGPPFLPGPAGVKPALAALDATHLLVVYAVGIDSSDSGVPNGSKLQIAAVDTAAPGAVSGADLTPLMTGAVGLDQSQPSTTSVQGSGFVTWWTAAVLGDPAGEELWLKRVGWSGGNLDLNTMEMPLPRWPQARVGDQRSSAVAASSLPPGGALVACWDDQGKGIASGEGNGDVVIELTAVPVLRTPGDGGP